MSKKLIVPLTAMVFLSISVFSLALWMNNESIRTDLMGSGFLDIISVNMAKPISVDGARWQLAIMVTNKGKGAMTVSSVYVNDKKADIFGMAHGDSLQNGGQIGTSIPVEGLHLEPGNSSNIYVWIGKDLFSSGTDITIHLNNLTQVPIRTVKLN